MQKTKTEKMQQTVKKQKFVGVKTLIDPNTGEEYPMQMNEIEDRDFNFTKVWLRNFIDSLDSISNQKLRLAFWIIDHLDKENQIIMTQRAMAEATGMSVQTVNATIHALCQAPEGSMPFLQKINKSGAYRVNPDVLYKGSHNNRMGVCYTYRQTDLQNEKQNEDISAKQDKDISADDENDEKKEK